jgi:hypothetical protein
MQDPDEVVAGLNPLELYVLSRCGALALGDAGPRLAPALTDPANGIVLLRDGGGRPAALLAGDTCIGHGSAVALALADPWTLARLVGCPHLAVACHTDDVRVLRAAGLPGTLACGLGSDYGWLAEADEQYAEVAEDPEYARLMEEDRDAAQTRDGPEDEDEEEAEGEFVAEREGEDEDEDGAEQRDDEGERGGDGVPRGEGGRPVRQARAGGDDHAFVADEHGHDRDGGEGLEAARGPGAGPPAPSGTPTTRVPELVLVAGSLVALDGQVRPEAVALAGELAEFRMQGDLELDFVTAWVPAADTGARLRLALKHRQPERVRRLLREELDAAGDFQWLIPALPEPGPDYQTLSSELVAALLDDSPACIHAERVRRAEERLRDWYDANLLAPLRAEALGHTDPSVRAAGITLANVYGLVLTAAPRVEAAQRRAAAAPSDQTQRRNARAVADFAALTATLRRVQADHLSLRESCW